MAFRAETPSESGRLQELEQLEQIERRLYPRLPVDCGVAVSPVSGSLQISGRLVELSETGCRVATAERILLDIQMRVEVQFQLRGIAFRLVGVTAGSRGSNGFALRFLEMPERRRVELAEVLAEVAAEEPVASDFEDAKAALSGVFAERQSTAREINKTPIQTTAVKAIEKKAAQAPILQPNAGCRTQPDAESRVAVATTRTAACIQVVAADATPAVVGAERRAHPRHAVDTSAKLLLVNTGICMPGRILNLSLSGCRLRTHERFNVGIYVRLEAEFYLHGLPFRLAGVSQAILDKHTIGVRFLDMSERKRGHLTDLIKEIDADEGNAALQALAESAG